MTKKQIELSIQKNELQLSLLEKFSHFGICWFLLSIPTIILFIQIQDNFKGNPIHFKENEIWIILIPLIFSFMFYKLQKRRLRLKSVNTNLKWSELETIIADIAEKLGWNLNIKNEKLIIATTSYGLFGRLGERITIIFDRNKVLINSICEPNSRSSLDSIGKNRRNINTLIEDIKKASH